MRVVLTGPSQSGKSTLFAAVAEAGGSHVDLSRLDQPHLAVVKVPDERLATLARIYECEKVTPAEVEFLDLPGFDLSDQAGRNRASVHFSAMRQSDALVFVVRAFANEAVGAYRGRIDPAGDVEEMLSEMLFADLDQVTSRIGKLETSLKRPTSEREEQTRELDLMKRLSAVLEGEGAIADAIVSEAEARLIRGFAFLSEKPALVAVNCSEDALEQVEPSRIAGLSCIRLSAKIEEEIACLPPSERGEFLADLGLTDSARDRLIRACYERMNLVTFLTVGKNQCRAWAIPAGADAVTAAGEVHSDMARGFIRAETVAYDDFREAGSIKGAKAAGKVRLEGKHYIVQDGDIINFRFNV